MRKNLALGCFAIAALISLWMWAFIEDWKWFPFVADGGTSNGFGNVLLVGFTRWFALVVAFVLEIGRGRLQRWSRHWLLQGFIVVVGITMMEVSMFFIYLHAVEKEASAAFRAVYQALVIAVPSCVIAGGVISSRIFFALGSLGALVAAVWRAPR